MNKEQAEVKLALMPLLTTVEVSYAEDMESGAPILQFFYNNIPGPGQTTIQIPLVPNSTNLADVVANLPLAAEDRLACVAVMLAPSQPGDEQLPL